MTVRPLRQTSLQSSRPFRAPPLVLFLLSALSSPAATNAQTGTIDFTTSLQQIEGFGFSDAFGEANGLRLLPAASQNTILNLLYSTQQGAGFSLLRLGIITDSNIEPVSPGSPTAPPSYVFDGVDGGQVWLAQQGQHFGLTNFFATAWSAPGFMKTNNSVDNGGNLCGVVGTNCATGDWRQAYANYLVQYVTFYKGVGVPIHALGFVNEPDQNVSYASMLFNTNQALDFIDNAFGPTVRASGLPLRTFCCDGSKWPVQTPFTTAIMGDSVASSYIDVISSHEYGGHATSPQPTTKPVWMTEWSSSNGTFEPRWDCGGCSGGPDGMYLANDIIQAFNAGNVNEYNYWWGTSTGPAALILTAPSTGNYTVAGRFWAIAAISRFVRPGAYMVSSTNTNPNLNVVAFRNTDGSKVFVAINTATTPVQANFSLDASTAGSTPRTFLTDTNDTVNETDTASVVGPTLTNTMPPRSLTTITIPPANIAGNLQIISTTALSRLGDGSILGIITIANNGSGTAQNIQLNSAQLGPAAGTPAPNSTLPLNLGSIAPGGSLTVPINFPSSAGFPGVMVIERVAGSYSGGNFGASTRAVLP